MYARTTDAVASGRKLIDDSESRSSNEYISFDTMSVPAPIERANSSVGSKIGSRISPYPYVRKLRAPPAPRDSTSPIPAAKCRALL